MPIGVRGAGGGSRGREGSPGVFVRVSLGEKWKTEKNRFLTPPELQSVVKQVIIRAR